MPPPPPYQYQQPQVNYNKKAASNAAAVTALKILEKRATEEVQRLAVNLERKKMAANQVPTNINRVWVSEAQRNLEAAKAELQRVKNALLNPAGTNAIMLLATTMKSQNNVRGRLVAALASKPKVPKKNLMAYTMKDLLTYLGS